MPHPFRFQSARSACSNATEANVFVHGYSAGRSDENKQLLLDKIPEQLKHYTNVFAFWPSNHIFRFDKSSLWRIGSASLGARAALIGAPMGSLGIVGALARDRMGNFTQARARAESMGTVLLGQLQDYLNSHHPQIKTINLIGHSLGGRLVISSLKSFSSRQQLIINEVLLMAAAIEVTAFEARKIRGVVRGRLINAYSKADNTLLLNVGETCLGRNEVEHFESIEMNDFGHTDYWERLPEVLTKSRFKAGLPPSPKPTQSSAPKKSQPARPNNPKSKHDETRTEQPA